jgi:hypothetical protein
MILDMVLIGSGLRDTHFFTDDKLTSNKNPSLRCMLNSVPRDPSDQVEPPAAT